LFHQINTTMQIINYRIKTSMGKVSAMPFGGKLDFLTQEQQDELDTIGYTGKNSNGVKMGRVEYLNSLYPEKEQFQLTQFKWDNGNFIEEFILTRVIIPQK